MHWSNIETLIIPEPEQVRHLHFSILDSTQEYLKREFSTVKDVPFFSVSTDAQTHGRGQTYHKQWVSPRGKGLLLSCHLVIQRQELLHTISQIVAISIIDLLKRMGFTPSFKWPNDVLLDNKKCAGILCEIIEMRHAIAGLGININTTPQELATIDQPSTSLYIESRKTYDVTSIRRAILRQLRKNWNHFQVSGFTSFAHRMNQHLAYKGKKVHVVHIQQQSSFLGTLDHVTQEGGLVVYHEDGTPNILFNGSIVPIPDEE